METIRILTKNGVDNTNIDGARDNNFNAGGRSGIVKGVLNEGLFTAQGNEIVFDTCELRISGHRVVLEEPSRITFSGIPYPAERFQYIAKITNTDGAISFELITTTIHELEQDDILNGNGVYELEIGRFTHDTSGNITDVVRTADVITGGTGSGGGGDFIVGNVTTQTLDAGLNAEVDVEQNPETGKVDFSFAIPQGESGGVTLDTEQTITGEKRFSHSNGIYVNRIHNLSGNAIYDFDGTNVRFGQTTLPLILSGSAARPKYTTDGTNFEDVAKISDIKDMVFPVHRVIITTDDISPATYLPNTTWERITDRVLIGAGNLYTAGSTGGSVTHKHSGGTLGAEVTISSNNIIINTIPQQDGLLYNPIAELTTSSRQAYTGAQEYIVPVIGNTSEANGLPPYLAVYIWRRIA